MLQFGLKSAIGLDISPNSVKLVELKKVKDKIFLLNIGKANISRPIVPEEEKASKLDEENTISAIHNILEKCKIKSKNIIASISSGDYVVVKHIKMPVASEKELRESIKYEADDYIPFEIDEVEIDFEITGEVLEHNETLMEVLLVAAKKDVVNQCEEMIKKIGFKTEIISVDTFALEDALSFQEEISGDEAIALIDIGSKITSINIIEKGNSNFIRVIHLGGNDFTEAIANTCGLSIEEAENLKISKGKASSPIESPEVAAMNISIITKTEDESTFLVNSVIDSVSTRLMNEITRSFSYYYTQLQKGKIERIVLCGGGAKLTNINDYLANGLGIPVNNINLFAKTEIDPNHIKDNMVHLQDPLYAVSFGLALRGLNL
ncbi:MAG: type IV pilus assembly protein PilM [bacterium]|nr:type IV pilus assembly protein PilM [bacterium]